MTRRFIDSLADGESIEEIYLVADRQLRANRNGNLFIQLDLRDRSGGIQARLWNAPEPLYRSFETGDFLAIRGKVQQFQGALQIILNHIERTDAGRVSLTDFLPYCEKDLGQLKDRLKTLLRKIGNPHLQGLVQCYLMDDEFMEGFCQCPAGIRVHHAYIGGLLEHVVTMLEIADKISPLYPDVDKDLVTVGVFLHDSGKVRELAFRRVFGYTDEGQLIGHLPLGLEILDKMIAKTPELTEEPFPMELALRIKHMIVSHHGELQYGSIKTPMTPEATLLHAIDMLDSRVHICTREIREDKGESSWTQFNQALQRKLYKGGKAGVDLGEE